MHTEPTLFSGLLEALRKSPERPSITVAEDWLQGRTVYGGLAAALCLEACQITLPTAPPLRAAQFAFVGPATGRLELVCTTLRRGKSTIFAGVDLMADRALATRATFCFGLARPSALSYANLAAPAVAAPNDCPQFLSAEPASLAFVQHFDWRLAGGARPMTRNADPEILLWVRHREDDLPPSLVSLLALADAPPPAAMVLFPSRAPISTMSWGVEVLDESVRTEGGWWLIRTAAQTVGAGYSSQAMTVWNRSGTPVLAARQSVAIFI